MTVNYATLTYIHQFLQQLESIQETVYKFTFYRCPDRVLTFESNDFAGRVHDGAVGADRPPDGVGGVGHVDDDDLSGLPDLLPDADVLVGLHREGVEPDVGGVDPHIGKLKCKYIGKLKCK